MKYILIWFVMAHNGSMTSGSASFDSDASCQHAAAAIERDMRTVWSDSLKPQWDVHFGSVRCYQAEGAPSDSY